MRRRPLVLIASLLASGLLLGGCSSMDPTEWFNTKKPLPGDRKEIFPGGVPGVPQGVPPELVEGYQQQAEPVPEPRVVEEKSKPKPKPKPRPRQAAAPRPAPSQQDQPAPTQSQSVFPEPPRR